MRPSLVLVILLCAACRDPRLDLDEREVAIEYIAHAAFRLHDADGERIVIDPFADTVWISYSYPDAKQMRADAVFVSHPHYDHDGGVSVGQESPYDLSPHTEPSTTHVGRFRVEGLEGRHARDYGADFGHRNTVWKISIAGLTIVHWGDNDADLGTLAEQLPEVDILMLPIDAYEHILDFDEVEAIRQALRPRVVIPMHYRLEGIERASAQELVLGNIEPWILGHDGSESTEFIPQYECNPDDETDCWTAYPELPPQANVVRVGDGPKIIDEESLPSRDEPQVWVMAPSSEVRG